MQTNLNKHGKTWANVEKRGKTMPLRNKYTVLTTKEAIKYLRISKPTYFKYISLGRIKAVKAGRGWKVVKSELHRFLKAPNG